MVEKTEGEAGRRSLSRLPSDDKLLAWSRGEVSGDEAVQIEEILTHHPEILKALKEAFPFPYSGKPGDSDYLSVQELDEDWAAMQARLALAKKPVSEPAAPKRGSHRARSSRRRFWSPAAVAALLAIFLGGFLFRAQQEVQSLKEELRSPHINVERRLLLPDGQRGARQPAILLPSGVQSFLLAPALTTRPADPEYRLDILRVTGQETKKVWSASGLQPRDDNTFEVLVPRAFLQPGDQHRLEIYGLRAGKAVLVATYTLELEGS